MSKIKKALLYILRRIEQVSHDRIPVYAAQASFFVIISVVPFLSLLVAVVSFFIPADIQGVFDRYTLPDNIKNILGSLLNELRTAPKVSLLSVSAVSTLWSAAKGMSAIRTGIERVYSAKPTRGFVVHKLWSLIGTLVFIVLIVAAVVLLLFGEYLVGLLSITRITEMLMYLRTPLLALFMCCLFTAMYAIVARRSTCVRRNVFTHLPGAAIAAVGWLLFSYIYSMYVQYFPSASYIYGGLGAVCLIMLWLYFCMMILLLGAELNKMFFSRCDQKKEEA